MEDKNLFKHIFFIAPLLGFSVSDIKLSGETEKKFEPVHNWPKYHLFGQISAVEIDNSGNVYIFHRGNRQWDNSTFSMNNIFNDKDKGPIPNETIVILDNYDGSLLQKTGANLFYLPHGLTVDDENNVWVTDVARHQVFKFPPIDFSKQFGALGEAKLTLGVPLEPGNDKMHFCKPTGVAVDKETKEFYVSDGYCNSRVIKYDQFGNVLLIFGRSSIGSPVLDHYMFRVPHSLALAQHEQTLFVADRENFRVVSYDFQSGKFKKTYAEKLKSRVFSIAYSPLQGGLLFVLTNDNTGFKMVTLYNVETGELMLTFSPKTNFNNPHDLAVSSDGKYCYVVELRPYKVWKFKLDLIVISSVNQHASNEDQKKGQKLAESIQEPIPAESKVDRISYVEVSSSFLATSLVVSLVVISFLIFMFHYYKRKGGYRRHEMRSLILDDDESVMMDSRILMKGNIR